MIFPHIHIPFQRIPEHLSYIRADRTNIELYVGAEVLDFLTPAAIRELREELDYHPSLSIHAPFMDLSPGAVDAKVREATMLRFHQVLDLAGDLRPKVVVFHSGYEKWRYGLNMDLWLEKSLQTWQPLLKIASGIGTRIAIENIFEDEPTNLRLLMEAMATADFGVCFDTGHFNLFAKTPLEDWMSALTPYILELHLHDNDGTADQHRPMGEGSFDFKRFFELLNGKDCVHTLEAHSREHALRSLQYHRKLLTGAGSGP
ncbi:MAG: sugar phosphate isomerase/epimerase family protein [Thermodesulfovibrionales bacterium]